MSTRGKETVCPECGHESDTFTTALAGPDIPPREGDITICIYCASVLVVTKDLDLAVPTISQMMGWTQRQHININRAVMVIKNRIATKAGRAV